MTQIAGLIPHAGAMVLLGRILHWDAVTLRCTAASHVDPHNPLRSAGRLAPVCGVEYALQAAALHGALCAGGTAQLAGYAASLRRVEWSVNRLDDQALGMLTVEVTQEARERFGMVYRFTITDGTGRSLLSGQFGIALPR